MPCWSGGGQQRNGKPGGGGGGREKPKTTHSIGETLKAVVVNTTAYGAFVRLPDGTEALLHVSEMSAPADTIAPQARDLVKPEDEVEVRCRTCRLMKAELCSSVVADPSIYCTALPKRRIEKARISPSRAQLCFVQRAH